MYVKCTRLKLSKKIILIDGRVMVASTGKRLFKPICRDEHYSLVNYIAVLCICKNTIHTNLFYIIVENDDYCVMLCCGYLHFDENDV